MAKGVVAYSISGATAGTKLREMIRALEIDVVNLNGKGEKVLDVFKLRDEVGAELKTLKEQGLNLKAEETRIETCDRILERQTPLIESELRKIGGLAGARKEFNPSEDKKYWFTDVPFYAAKAARRKNLLIALPIIIVVLAVLGYISITLWGPGNVKQRASATFKSGVSYLERRELDNAAREFQSAIRMQKTFGEAMTYLGVVYELQGNTAESSTILKEAQAVMKDRRKYLLTLGEAYRVAGEPDKAIETLTILVSNSPKYTEGYFARAAIYEATGKAQEAFDDYTKAAELAQASGLKKIYDESLLRLNFLKKTVQTGN
ncbi:MAG: tetratricopeptide repeat protein [Chloroflexi bacterium]|nr:tetratricopeptide repeat protein [Chloroflexota bacterium]